MVELIMGLATAFNFLVLKHKLEHKRYADVAYDAAALLTLTLIFGGTLGGMTIAMVAGLVISIYLYYMPPKKPKWDKKQKTIIWV